MENLVFFSIFFYLFREMLILKCHVGYLYKEMRNLKPRAVLCMILIQFTMTGFSLRVYFPVYGDFLYHKTASFSLKDNISFYFSPVPVETRFHEIASLKFRIWYSVTT